MSRLGISSKIFFGVLFASCLSAEALADCTPVAYVFRHAEEKGGGVRENNLYPIGNVHAELYPEMVESYQPIGKDYCPVKWVYAVSITKPDGSLGTSNPFYTGRPLALRVMGADPITKVPNGSGGNKRLGEFLKDGEKELLQNDIKSKLHSGGASVALFWTRQGMNDLATSLYSDAYIAVGSNNPRRNAMFRFNYKKETNSFYKQSSKWIQCFNFNPYEGGFTSATYQCLKSGNLRDLQNREIVGNGGILLDNTQIQNLKGKICDSEELGDTTGNIFQGSCELLTTATME